MLRKICRAIEPYRHLQATGREVLPLTHRHHLPHTKWNPRAIRVGQRGRLQSSFISSLYLATMSHHHLLLFLSHHHLLLFGFKKCQAYHSSHSYQLPNYPCLSASPSLFLSRASSNERLINVSTVTSYQLHPFLPHLFVFSPPCLSIIYYSLSRNERLTSVPTVTSYQLQPFLPLP